MDRNHIKAVWKTDDGRMFDTSEEAETYLRRREVVEWLLLNLSSDKQAREWAGKIVDKVCVPQPPGSEG